MCLYKVTSKSYGLITEVEALSWVNADKSKEAILQAFIKEANILYITHGIVKECVRIRRSKKMKTPDALIAATAIVYKIICTSLDLN